ncbi:DNA topoisomerase IV subunit B [Candidatus Spongiihabitans sp.]|uniref:DNA topoisomerase IV subunit B n=1 Tax=Candidatus Spongiihabitans sp. TaxID=3101308 RepID=UPI003C6ECFD1
MSSNYTASAIEVLTGIEPVRKRPGMYTDTERPNHLAHEVIDNSVDEAIAGHADSIEVQLHQDGSVTVADNGRGMPVDIHREEGVSGVELIMTRLHAGGKFSGKHYQYSGGLHGVGVSVVNALSTRLEVWIRRNGEQHHISFANGEKKTDLKVTEKIAKKVTGTTIRFHPDAEYFDSSKFHVARLKRVLRAKAVLCPGLYVSFLDDNNEQNNESWQYQEGLQQYLCGYLGDADLVPATPYIGRYRSNDGEPAGKLAGELAGKLAGELDWAVAWVTDGGECITESYVNLVPTVQGGTHVTGFRSGLTEAIRAFCEFRGMLPRGVKLTPEDIWVNCTYILSTRINEPQFSGQTKDRLSSRETTPMVQAAVRDAFGLWLNQHFSDAEKIAQIAIDNAQRRLRAGKRVQRKKITSGPALPGKLADCTSDDLEMTELFLVEGDSAGGSAKQARDRIFQAVMPLRGKILNTWEVISTEVLASQEVHDIAVALGVDPGFDDLSGLRYGRICILADADSDGAHIAALLCALFLRHFPALVEAGRVCIAMPPLFRIDVAKKVYYALDESDKNAILEHIESEKIRGKVNIQRFKGLGEMNPLQLRETTMNPSTRSLLQLEVKRGDGTHSLMDMLLAKKRAADRKSWLNDKGDKADIS